MIQGPPISKVWTAIELPDDSLSLYDFPSNGSLEVWDIIYLSS